MGIQGLLPLLKSIHKSTHLRNFAGQTIGVDAYGWLHRGTVSCALELAQGKPSRRWVDFFMNRVRMLIHFGVKPYLVFDGDYLPSKSHTEKERSARRKESRKLGLQLLQAGKTSQAHLELQKTVDVTPLMARELIEELKAMNVPYVVAPYEADSQLAYLEQQGVIDGVLSEDSDLLVFGVQCLLTKLDQYGECVMVRRDDFTSCREISLVGWKLDDFRMMAMLSGCDYLPGIDKMGLKTAYRLVRKHKTIERVVKAVQFDGKMKVAPGYLEAFTKAEQTFLYQWVYCPEKKQLVNLNKVPKELNIDDMPYVGHNVESAIAQAVARGDLDPNTKKSMNFVSRAPPTTRRAHTMQTPNEKPGKPISEFFKAQRTPLAELDPNAFTPSPSQRNLLAAQQGSIWSASQAPAVRPSSLARTASMPVPSSAPLPLRRLTSTQVPGIGSAPPKKARLCSDGNLASSMNGDIGIDSVTSRFFGKLGNTASRRASAKKDEFELWSDDSIQEDMAVLADTPSQPAREEPTVPSQSPKKRKRFQVFADPAVATGQPTEDSQSTARSVSQGTTISALSQSSNSVAAPATPLTSFESATSTSTIFGKGIATSMTQLTSKWASTSCTAPTTLQLAKSVSARRATDPPPDAKPTPALTTPAPPLAGSEDIVPASSPPQPAHQPDDEGDKQIIADEEWLEIEQRPLDFGSESAVKGSEDMIVPDSPHSVRTDASDREEAGDARERLKRHFGQFAYCA
ncbi:Rad2 nuclease [Oleoguttula sp. CCFEE 5521]